MPACATLAKGVSGKGKFLSLRGARRATKQSPPLAHAQAKRDCFAEFTLGLAGGETRGLAMTTRAAHAERSNTLLRAFPLQTRWGTGQFAPPPLPLFRRLAPTPNPRRVDQGVEHPGPPPRRRPLLRRAHRVV